MRNKQLTSHPWKTIAALSLLLGYSACTFPGSKEEETAATTTNKASTNCATSNSATCATHVSSVSPSSGLISGGTKVTLRGGGFTPGTAVLMGESECMVVDVPSSSKMICLTLGNVAGIASLVVATPDGVTKSSGDFTFVSDLAVTPASVIVPFNSQRTFTAKGGVPPYSFSVLSGSGTIDNDTGVYTSPGDAGSTTIAVTDTVGNKVFAEISDSPSVSLSPTTKNLKANATFTFGVSDGAPPYHFAIVSGTGTINADTGTFKAPATVSTTVVRVTDDSLQTSDATIVAFTSLAMAPIAPNTTVNGTVTFTASGGVGPYTFTQLDGGGQVTSGGVYTAPNEATVATIIATDSIGNKVQTTVKSTDALLLDPPTKQMAQNAAGAPSNFRFRALGGTPPYTFSVITGGAGGSVDGTLVTSTDGLSAEYTAPSTTGTDKIQVVDSAPGTPATSESTITVVAGVVIRPKTKTLTAGSSFQFIAAGGGFPFTYSMVSGGGAIASNGNYTAPATVGQATVRVTNGAASTDDAVVTIVPAFSISPSIKNLNINDTTIFVATGGVGPYSYFVEEGTGTIDALTGTYTAPSSSGDAVILALDSLENEVRAHVFTHPALAISPASPSIAVDGSATFTATGGVSPYVFAVTSGGGSIDATTHVYLAPSTPDTVVIRVTDAVGGFVSATVTIVSKVGVDPEQLELAIGNAAEISATGGLQPLSFTIVSGGAGALSAGSGADSRTYTAGGSAGTATVRVTDALGTTADVAVTIRAALSVTPATKTLSSSNSFTFTAENGVPPYRFSVLGGGSGAVHETSGTYTAGAAGSATVRATDYRGNIADATVTVNAGLAISPAVVTVAAGATQQFTGVNGTGPYTFAVTGTGSISAGGLYTAPTTAGTSTVVVTDSANPVATATATLTITVSDTVADFTGAAGRGGRVNGLATGQSGTAYAVGFTEACVACSKHWSYASNVWTTRRTDDNGATWETVDTFQRHSARSSSAEAVTVDPSGRAWVVGFGRRHGRHYGRSWDHNWGAERWIVRRLGCHHADHRKHSDDDDEADNISDDDDDHEWHDSGRHHHRRDHWRTVDDFRHRSHGHGLSRAQAVTQVGIGKIYVAGYAYAHHSSCSIGEGDEHHHHFSRHRYHHNTGGDRWIVRGTTDDGRHWNTIDAFQPVTNGDARANGIAADSTGKLYAAGFATATAAENSVERWVVRKSSNRTSWSTSETFSNGGRSAVAHAIHVDKGGIIYAAGAADDSSDKHNWVVRQSKDAGATWTQVDTYQLVAGQHATAKAVTSDSRGNLYVSGWADDAAGKDRWIARMSTDGGATWTTLESYALAEGKASHANALTVLLNNVLLAAGFGTDSSGKQHWLIRRR